METETIKVWGKSITQPVAKWDDVLREVEQDCEIKTSYYEDGKTCALGHLAHVAGVDVAALKAAANWPIEFGNVWTKAIEEAIAKYFQLSIHDQTYIQHLNDRAHTPELRREAIKLYIDNRRVNTDLYAAYAHAAQHIRSKQGQW